MICMSCGKNFKLIKVGDAECPNCKIKIHTYISEFTTNIPEFKKYIFQNNLFFAFAIISIPFSYIIGDERLSAAVCLLLIIFPNLTSAFGAGFITSRFGTLLKSDNPNLFKLITFSLLLLFTFTFFSVIGFLI